MTDTRVAVTGQAITVERLVLSDPTLAAFLAEASEADRPALAERALRIGLLAICNANATVNVDVVKAEFGRLVADMSAKQAEAAQALEATLRTNFADQDGRLPRQLEAYLGDSGKLNRLVGDLFDEGRRDSALGRLRELLGRYFEGDGSQLATLLDPTRHGSPLYQFRSEMTGEFRRLNERLEAIEVRRQGSGRGAREGHRQGRRLRDRARESAWRAGARRRRPRRAHGHGRRRHDGQQEGRPRHHHRPEPHPGARLRIVVEAKDRPMPLGRMTTELAQARVNRSAAIALAVFTPHTAQASVSPLALVGNDVFATYDPETDDGVALEAAYRPARILALFTLRDAPVQIDAAAVSRPLRT